MKKILSLGLAFIFICQAGDMKNEENRMIDLDGLKVKYINFTPKKINKACLSKKIDKLLKIIEISRIKSSYQLPVEQRFDSEEMKITKKEMMELSNQLVMKKHISTKGNHEWQKLVSRKHIVIEDEKRHVYIMYPLEPMMFIMSGIAFEKINKGEVILVRGLKNWVDVKGCMQL